MSFETMMRLTEILLALVVLQTAVEHIWMGRDRVLFAARALVCIWLFTGMQVGFAVGGLWLTNLVLLHRFGGPYNGGADKMTMLITTCLGAAHLLPQWQELAMAYLAVQLVLSYFVSGYVKLVNPEWRSGQALVDVFRFSAYPVSESLRRWADHPKMLWLMSWSVIGFEVIFPLTLLNSIVLLVGMAVAATFHLANACLFGLNRFFWIWLCAYPSLIWFQERVFANTIY